MTERVVVTGAGVVSPIAAGLEEFEGALYGGAVGIGPSARFEGAVTAEVANFTPQQWLGTKGLRVLDRTARLLAVAAHMGLAGLSQDPAGDPELGMVCGTLFGSVHSITAFDWSGLTDGPSLVNPMEFPNTVINSPAGQAAIRHKLRGVNSTLCAGLASGLYALDYAAEFLRFGRARALLAGGVEELCEESLLGFCRMGAVSPSGTLRPFSAERDGTIPGEGCALLLLEREDDARARGAVPWFEIRGFGSTQDAHSIQAYQVRAAGATAAIEEALARAGITPSEVGCIIASANGARAGDDMEARALRNVLGERLESIPVCAPKAAWGEAMGASGALAALTAGIALRRGCVPPTAGCASNGELRLSAAPQPLAGEYALVNAFGCDGNNASLVVRLCRN